MYDGQSLLNVRHCMEKLCLLGFPTCSRQNWEFEGYNNNRTNSFVRDGVLFIKPTLTAERYGEEFLTSGTLDMNGGAPYDQSVPIAPPLRHSATHMCLSSQALRSWLLITL